MAYKITAGFVGFGEVNTPRAIIEKKCREAAGEIESLGIEVQKVSTVADDPEGAQAKRASEELGKKNFDFLVACVAGWIPSWAVIKTIENFRHKPVLLWGIAGHREKGRFVTTAAQAGTAALRRPMQDMNFRFRYLVTMLGEKSPLKDIGSFARAAHAAGKLGNATVGMAGYRDMRLYGTLYDAVKLKDKLGTEVEHFDLLEIYLYMQKLSTKDMKDSLDYMASAWNFTRKPRKKTLADTVRLYLALKHKVDERGYSAISYTDVDGIKKLMEFAPAGALTLLHDKMNICSIPENDSMGAVTQLATFFLTGEVPAYLEFYEFTPGGALMGVPDYVPSGIVDGQVKILPNSFGDFGEGLLNVSRLKTGRVTLARLDTSRGDYVLHAAAGTAKTPPQWEEAGWAPPAPQLASLEIDFDAEPGAFIQNVLSQHYIIAYGDRMEDYKNLCSLLNISLLEHK